VQRLGTSSPAVLDYFCCEAAAESLNQVSAAQHSSQATPVVLPMAVCAAFDSGEASALDWTALRVATAALPTINSLCMLLPLYLPTFSR